MHLLIKIQASEKSAGAASNSHMQMLQTSSGMRSSGWWTGTDGSVATKHEQGETGQQNVRWKSRRVVTVAKMQPASRLTGDSWVAYVDHLASCDRSKIGTRSVASANGVVERAVLGCHVTQRSGNMCACRLGMIFLTPDLPCKSCGCVHLRGQEAFRGQA